MFLIDSTEVQLKKVQQEAVQDENKIPYLTGENNNLFRM